MQGVCQEPFVSSSRQRSFDLVLAKLPVLVFMLTTAVQLARPSTATLTYDQTASVHASPEQGQGRLP